MHVCSEISHTEYYGTNFQVSVPRIAAFGPDCSEICESETQLCCCKMFSSVMCSMLLVVIGAWKGTMLTATVNFDTLYRFPASIHPGPCGFEQL